MAPDRLPEPRRDRFTVLAEAIETDVWHITVLELPATWTVAFSLDELESRARTRIALDLDCQPDDFDVVVQRTTSLFLERRSYRREDSN
jgi:hypothetical protein